MGSFRGKEGSIGYLRVSALTSTHFCAVDQIDQQAECLCAVCVRGGICWVLCEESVEIVQC